MGHLIFYPITLLIKTGLLPSVIRYYDPQLGQFISPDTLVPDATNLFDYNRYMYARGNPMKYNDPTGHCALSAAMGPSGLAFDIPCWASGAGEVAALATAGALASPVASQEVVKYILNEPPLNYPSPYPNADIGNGNISVTIPVPGSTTLTTGGVPLTSDNQTSLTGVTPGSSPTQQIVEPLPAQQKGTHIVYQSPLGRGSTGRTVANNLKEQLAMDEVMANPGAGRQLPLKMTDPRWPAADGWVKMAHNANGVEVHYVYNPSTGDFDDAKFK